MGSSFGKAFQHDPNYIAPGAGSDGQQHTKPTPPPQANPFVMPTSYASHQSQLQSATYNPRSTRMFTRNVGIAKHF